MIAACFLVPQWVIRSSTVMADKVQKALDTVKLTVYCADMITKEEVQRWTTSKA
jgi:hypothetical protein